MVKLDVMFKCDLENVTELTLPTNARWYFNIEFEGDEKEIYLIPAEKLEVPNSRGECCFVMHSKETKKHATVTFIKNAEYNESDSGKLKRIGTFECRGCELVKFLPRSGWEASSTKSDTSFDDIDLTEGDWADYDERGNESVMISELETEICRSKEK
jgi:hypothetical protein|uniref:Uncharacterized protein n=1 Tax=Eutreptiella gymnastica TaxID=73025 RepID=A0A7S4LER7_9EUGL|eukprot:CAMPEP_0174303166 /NCGR_PEP_ID=MMETSP0809-20121228/59978_1 /TAXON_ID=73025 ORGANISM="Eutreptiella gymnastica-like, Strain CCMP1594" /NCGR_SAMPLE_ID=MMETSP0809 /ASSEMBLY_ACC=CAM_ASM_000658 /LENGTH=156 /DNA_ID=CAMNT_0015409135 /DNA_START=31 /DNA_END=501 /DNA_ORIENTATION=+